MLFRPPSRCQFAEALLQPGPGEHGTTATSLADQPHISTQTHHLPTIAATRMSLLKPHRIAEMQLQCQPNPSESRISLMLSRRRLASLRAAAA